MQKVAQVDESGDHVPAPSHNRRVIERVVQHLLELLHLKLHPDGVECVADRDTRPNRLAPKDDAGLVKSVNHTGIMRIVRSAFHPT